ncbi:MAG: hypothetical protein IPP47_33050 [Bryobacterales bacterium]|nr:hypothetical protein [Bryobacterales bacterium]
MNFRAKATGDVVSVAQPEGFIGMPESSLRVHLYERQFGVFQAASFEC